MPPVVDLEAVWNFATALLIGALLGIERERHKREHDEQTIGGLRTFILFALIGALGGWLTLVLESPWILGAALLASLAPVLAGYVISARTQPDALGLTTELAAVAAFLLGAMTTLGYRELAVGLGVAVAAVLAYKQPLHGLVQRLDRDDVYAGLRLLIATFIVLPLLPDQPIDPWGALRPRSLWMLVLLISSLSLVGYVATRLLGAHRGIPLTGLTGGLVSSTAVTLAFSRQSREPGYAAAAPALASGILLAWAVMFARVIVEVLVVNRALLGATAGAVRRDGGHRGRAPPGTWDGAPGPTVARPARCRSPIPSASRPRPSSRRSSRRCCWWSSWCRPTRRDAASTSSRRSPAPPTSMPSRCRWRSTRATAARRWRCSRSPSPR